MKICFIYQNLKNKEDFALTPYLFLVNAYKNDIYGLGLCFGFWAIGGVIVLRKSKMPFFINLK